MPQSRALHAAGGQPAHAGNELAFQHGSASGVGERQGMTGERELAIGGEWAAQLIRVPSLPNEASLGARGEAGVVRERPTRGRTVRARCGAAR